MPTEASSLGSHEAITEVVRLAEEYPDSRNIVALGAVWEIAPEVDDLKAAFASLDRSLFSLFDPSDLLAWDSVVGDLDEEQQMFLDSQFPELAERGIDLIAEREQAIRRQIDAALESVFPPYIRGVLGNADDWEVIDGTQMRQMKDTHIAYDLRRLAMRYIPQGDARERCATRLVAHKFKALRESDPDHIHHMPAPEVSKLLSVALNVNADISNNWKQLCERGPRAQKLGGMYDEVPKGANSLRDMDWQAALVRG